MSSNNGYIYVRNHQSYNVDNVCKMGKAINIPERDTVYATGEFKRGYFEVVFEVPIEKMVIVERLLQQEFRELNVRFDAGTEFYNKTIIYLIEPYLNSIGIKYKKLSNQAIHDLTRCNRVRNTFKKINIQKFIHILHLCASTTPTLSADLTCKGNSFNALETCEGVKTKRTSKQSVSYIPRNDQTILIEKSVKHFEDHDKGLYIITCGVGKTLISLWTTQKLNSHTILIGVPNILLLKQWKKVICVLFQNVPCLHP